MSRILFTGGCLLPGGAWSQGGLLPGGCLFRGVPGPRGTCAWGVSAPGGAWWRPPERLLLRVVRILLECILVVLSGHFSSTDCRDIVDVACNFHNIIYSKHTFHCDIEINDQNEEK